MQNNNFNREAKLVLDIVNKIIYNKTPHSYGQGFGKINLALLRKMIAYHELEPFAYAYFKSCPFILPEEMMDYFRKAYHFFLFRNLYFEQEFLKLNRLFIEQNLVMVPIKGLALLQDVYKEYLSRPMVDMDVLVKEEDFDKAEDILLKSGYSKDIHSGNEMYWKDNNCNLPFKKKGERVLLELHFALDLKRFNGSALSDIWKRLRVLNNEENKIKLLSPEDTLFSLALHQRRFGKSHCLKNALDFTLMLNTHKYNFDWDYVIKGARSGRACSTIFFVLFQAKILLDMAIPQAVFRSLKIPFWKRKLMRHFIKKNTFLADAFVKAKQTYLKSHFLLYDSLREPIKHILNITHEEFAKFYNLLLYSPETEKLYKFRFLYIPYRLTIDSLRGMLIKTKKIFPKYLFYVKRYG